MKKKVSIIGGGPSAFMLAAFLDNEKFKVTIYEKNKTSGRKFLVAGKGGFNLTHSEPIEQLIDRYTPNKKLTKALLHFTNEDFRNWLDQIGISTYVGSSKRVYPEKGIKPIEVLQAILKRLNQKGVEIKYNQAFTDWDEDQHPIINEVAVVSDYTVFCLGGASWKVTGSTGEWQDTFSKKGIKIQPFQASNCACKINWIADFINKNEGVPLKNIVITCNNQVQKGEAVITKFGIEGNAIYGLSPQIRKQLNTNSKAEITIDFKPSLNLETVQSKLENSIYTGTTRILKKELKLSTAQMDLLKLYLSKEEYLNNLILATYIKSFPITITDIASIDEAISTVGGVDYQSINEHFELLQLPQQYCIGEMLDWDAPTGGYLLQACMSMGSYLGHHLNNQFKSSLQL